jgi:hypothetical protein
MSQKPTRYDTIRSGTARTPGLLRPEDWARWTAGTNPATPTTPGTLSAADKARLDIPLAGITAARPVAPPTGYAYFDTTLGKPVWYNGASWVDATGAAA